jgi:2,4-dienoyl-CoA reductase-like NADH-dependent reductase (Old Yellow Enzyme family)
VARAVRSAVPDLAVLAKVNLSDGLAGGWEVADTIVLVRALNDVGVDGAVLSGGLVQRNAFYLLRGQVPIVRMAANESSWLQRVAMRAFAPFLVKPYAFSPLFFRQQALQVRAAVPDATLVLLGGVTGAADLQTAVDDGFDAVALGRALLHDPDFVRRCLDDAAWTTGCTRCNACVATMDEGGVRCVLHDPPATASAP